MGGSGWGVMNTVMCVCVCVCVHVNVALSSSSLLRANIMKHCLHIYIFVSLYLKHLYSTLACPNNIFLISTPGVAPRVVA